MLRRVMPFEPLDQPPSIGGGESLVKRGFAVNVQIVLDENDALGLSEVQIGQIFQSVSV